MSNFSFPIVWDSKDPQQIVCQTIVSYFNDLGEKLVELKKNNGEMNISDINNPSYIFNMRQIACASPLLDSGFAIGTEHRICEELFGVKPGELCNYHWYFNKVYKAICNQLGLKYISYEKSIIKLAVKAHGDLKMMNAHKSFKDLYDFIQDIKLDSNGYYDVSHYTALHVYDTLEEVDICEKDLHGKWVAIAKFIFNNEESMVAIFPMDSNELNYQSPHWESYMNVRISQIKKSPEMPCGSKIKKILFAAM